MIPAGVTAPRCSHQNSSANIQSQRSPFCILLEMPTPSAEFSGLKFSELQAMCKRLGLSAQGNKTQLLEKLSGHATVVGNKRCRSPVDDPGVFSPIPLHGSAFRAFSPMEEVAVRSGHGQTSAVEGAGRMRTSEEEMQQAEALISQLSREIQSKDALLQAKDAVIQSKDDQLRSKEALLQIMMQSRDELLALKNTLLAKDEEIRKLREAVAQVGAASAAGSTAHQRVHARAGGGCVAAAEMKPLSIQPEDDKARCKNAASRKDFHNLQPGTAAAVLAGTEYRKQVRSPLP
jgi:hypothetical protein